MESNILIFILVGFIAQMIDGALGMAYGVTSTTFLLNIGIAPATASASVHTAKIFTTLVSGLSHLKFGNVDKTLFRKLVVPGVLGGITGAYVLTSLPGDKLRPFIAIYLLVMGLRILWKALRTTPQIEQPRPSMYAPLGIIGGFFDAIGGGGWGPIVTGTLVGNGHNPRLTIGSVNAAEFFVTFAETFILLLSIKLTNWQVILGLIIGGVVAAPLAALASRYLSPQKLMVFIGGLIVLLSLRTLFLSVSPG